MIPKILQRENTVLRKISDSVPPEEVRSEKIQSVIRDMSEALSAQDDGVAIAAPQIGVLLRIFLLSEKVTGALENENKETPDKKISLPRVFVNPVIVKRSREKHSVEEGCLSVRYAYGMMKRTKKVTVRALDSEGTPFERGASGLLAQIFQHEIDHLNGILFIDSATAIRELTQEELAREREQLEEK